MPDPKAGLKLPLRVVEFGDNRLPERFWSKAHIASNGCWEWTGGKFTSGYGVFKWLGRSRYVHRITYSTFRGPIVLPLQCDHLCRNRACCNPSHIELVTQSENISRGMSATHARGTPFCRPGLHRITEGNVYTTPGGKRECRVCRKEKMAAHYIAKKAKLAALGERQ